MKCPKCSWQYDPIRKRPKTGSTIKCPQCGSMLKYKSADRVFSSILVLFFIVSFPILLAADDTPTALPVFATVIVVGLSLIGAMLAFQKLELENDPSVFD